MKICILGIDGMDPRFVESNIKYFPTFHQMTRSGCVLKYLKSSIPPITIPAWPVIYTGLDPSQLKLYGFRSRIGKDYSKSQFVSSHMLKGRCFWDKAASLGYQSSLIGLPLTSGLKPEGSKIIYGFPTPEDQEWPCWPINFLQELGIPSEEFLVDVPEYRKISGEELIYKVYYITQQRFDLTLKAIEKKGWTILMMQDMGMDRMNHRFLRSEEGNNYKNSAALQYLIKYYNFIDQQVNLIREAIDQETYLLIISDHGADDLKGFFALNAWFVKNGFITLKEEPSRPLAVDQADINWSKTKAWAMGGHVAKIYINKEHRERNGCIPYNQIDAVLDEIRDKLSVIRTKEGRPLLTSFYKCSEIYKGNDDMSPDAIAYFDHLKYKCSEEIGLENDYLPDTYYGLDSAVHSQYGIALFEPTKGDSKLSEKQQRYNNLSNINEVHRFILESIGLY